MRFLFLCSGLEAGADGVGDYTRRLAGELVRRGHEAGAIALHDPSGAGVVLEPIESGRMPVLRLNCRLAWAEREQRARRFRQWFGPDLVSVQFVCFGYHSKGLPFRLLGRLRRIAGPTQVHWMFHELWVGRSIAEAPAIRLWGLAQRGLVLSLHRQLRPRLTQTTTHPYAAVLRRHEIEATVQPLFGNVPVAAPSGRMRRDFEALGISPETRGAWWLLGLFGASQWDCPSYGWLRHAIARAGSQGRRVALLGIGHLPAQAEFRFREIAAAAGAAATTHHFGPRSAQEVSEFLQLLDAGLSPMEPSAIGKSGAAAAMREHGLPILMVRGDEHEMTAVAEARACEQIDRLLGGTEQRAVLGIDRLGQAADALIGQRGGTPT